MYILPQKLDWKLESRHVGREDELKPTGLGPTAGGGGQRRGEEARIGPGTARAMRGSAVKGMRGVGSRDPSSGETELPVVEGGGGGLLQEGALGPSRRRRAGMFPFEYSERWSYQSLWTGATSLRVERGGVL